MIVLECNFFGHDDFYFTNWNSSFCQSVSINEFLKPAEGESHYNSGGRGRGRGGRGTRGGGGGGGFRGNSYSNVPAPSIEDPGHFPTLGAK